MSMPRTWSLILIGLLGARFGAESSAQPQTDEQAAQRMARYNVVWTNPSKDAAGVMPIGNGDIAVGVYAIENGDLFLLLAKNDAFSYCGDLYKTGRVRVSLNPNPFIAGKPFQQTLDLPTASIRLEAAGVKLRIWPRFCKGVGSRFRPSPQPHAQTVDRKRLPTPTDLYG